MQSRKHRASVACLMVALAACSDDAPGGSAADAGSGAAGMSGSAGSVGGVAGSSAGGSGGGGGLAGSFGGTAAGSGGSAWEGMAGLSGGRDAGSDGSTAGAASALPEAGPEIDAGPQLSFAADIHPFLNRVCNPCHVERNDGGHSVGSADIEVAYADALDLGSDLIDRAGSDMPPPNATPPCDGGPGTPGCLSVEEFEMLEAWFDRGSAP